MLEQRIVVKNENGTRRLHERALQVAHYLFQAWLRQRIEQVDDGGLRRKYEPARVSTFRLQIEAFLLFAFELAQVLLRNTIQFGQQFHSANARKGIFRSHQQYAAFSGAKVNECEFGEVDLQTAQH